MKLSKKLSVFVEPQLVNDSRVNAICSNSSIGMNFKAPVVLPYSGLSPCRRYFPLFQQEVFSRTVTPHCCASRQEPLKAKHSLFMETASGAPTCVENQLITTG